MKTIFLFIILYISASESFAQLKFGLKINWTANKFILKLPENQQSSSSSQGLKSYFGLSGGALANYKLNRSFSLQSEFIFNAFSTSFYKMEYYINYNGDRRMAGNDFNIQMQYLEIPMLGKISVGNKVTFDIVAGGFVGYRLSAKQSTQDAQLDLPQDLPYDPMMDPKQIRIPYPTQNVSSDYTKFNAGVLVGCGVTMRDLLVFEIRVNRGLADIYKAEDTKIKTLQGQFTVGYYLFRQKAKTSLQ